MQQILQFILIFFEFFIFSSIFKKLSNPEFPQQISFLFHPSVVGDSGLVSPKKILARGGGAITGKYRKFIYSVDVTDGFVN